VSSDALRRLLDFDAVLLAIAAELTAPLLRGGELQAERDLARAQTDEALAQYAQAVLTAFREVESALRAEALLAQQEAALQIAARESRAAEELALERYRAGLVDIVTWLEARRRAFDARSALLSVNNQRLQNRIALHLGLGGDFTAPATDAAMTAPPVAPGGAPR
jgi:outer membrane protein TolC